MKKIYHVINPYKAKEGSSAYIEQKKTLDSLFNALHFVGRNFEVILLMKVFDVDYDYFSELYGSCSKVCIVKLTTETSKIHPPFKTPRQLPLLDDFLNLEILSRDANDDDIVLVTNMDICVQPFFYIEILRIRNTGRDVFVINRRTVSKELINDELIEAYVSEGDKHIGHDCFVFPFKLLKLFDIRDHILGIGFVFRPFLLNCILHATVFDEFDDVFLTFHYGDDMSWKDDKFDDYLEHNKNRLIAVYRDNQDLIELANADERKKKWIDKFFNFSFLEEC